MSLVRIPLVVPSKHIKLGTAIEKGSFGVVQKARWLRAVVAIKVLPTLKPKQKEAFLMEMDFACGLRHPNIVATMGAVTDNYCALIMELMPWGSLKASLNDPRRRSFFNFDKMTKGMMSICRAGAYLSSVSVIHRDISSKNVFVSTAFEAMKLGDFGYSSLLEHHIKDRQDPLYGQRITDDAQIFAGAPAYKAPELLSAKPNYSEASDIFAFSIVGWEMLTTLWSGTYGRPWSDVVDISVLTEAVISGKRPLIEAELYQASERHIDQTSPLVALIEQCWQDGPEKRPTFLDAHDVIRSTLIKKKSPPRKTPSRTLTLEPLEKTQPIEKTIPIDVDEEGEEDVEDVEPIRSQSFIITKPVESRRADLLSSLGGRV